MIHQENQKDRPVKVGNVVQLRINKVDLSKADCKNLTLLIIDKIILKKDSLTYYLIKKYFKWENFVVLDL